MMSKMANTPICDVCKKPIKGAILSALGKYYHPEHFVCEKCKKPIKGDRFQFQDGKPYCAEDYAELFAPKCHACNKPITDRIVRALGYDWHEDHFVCVMCNTKLTDQVFKVLDGKPVCQKCFESNLADKCKACGKGISDKIVVALGEKWHPECFVCVKCKKPITDNLFQVENGLPICSACASLKQ